jgi:autotransporter-associated beta strand protein
MKRKPIVSALVIAAASVPVLMRTTTQAQTITPVGYSGGTYTQNFDTLPVRSPTGSTTGSVNFSTMNVTPSVIAALTTPTLYGAGVTPPAELNGWGFTRIGGTGTAGTNFVWNAGQANSGAVYNYGLPDQTDRALGTVASGSVTPRIGLVLVNNSASTYSGFTLGFISEQWRSSTSVTNSLKFGYSVGALENADSLFGGTPQGESASLDAPALAPVASNGDTNGSLPAFQTARSGVVSGNGFTWAPGQVLVLTWSDTNDGGNDAGIGIDDLSFSATIAAAYTPKNLSWTGSTNRIWDTSTPNWAGEATTYTENTASGPIIADNVTFTATGAGVVTIRPEGVQPNSVLVDSGANYTFEGGPITGPTSLVKRGGGTLTLTSPNTFSGGVQVRGGTLEFSNDNQLGSAGSPLLVTELSTIRINGPVVAARGIVVPEGGATFNTLGNNVVFGGLSVGTINVNFPTVTKTGAGDLSVASVFTAFGSVIRISEGSLTIRASGNVTNSFGVDSDASYQGNLILDGHQQLDLAGADGEPFQRNFSGGGQIIVKGPGRASETVSYSGANTTTLNARTGNIRIENAIVVNPDNNPNFRINFGASDSTTGQRRLTIAGPVTGNTEVNFRDPGFTDPVFGSSGTVVIETPLQHTGRTTITMSQNGVVRLNTPNAFPATTALVFGDGFYNNPTIGALDLNGNNLTVASLESQRRTSGTNGLQPSLIGGIVNTTGNLATVTITGNATTVYDGGIGNFSSSNVATPSTAIGLTLAASHTGQLTLTGAAGTVNYTGNTQVLGGKLTLALPYVSRTSTITTANSAELDIVPISYAEGQPRVALEVAALQVNDSSRVRVPEVNRAGGVPQGTVVVSSLSVAPSAFVDLTNNDLIVRGGNLAAIRALVGTWYTADGGLPGAIGLGSSNAFYDENGGFTTLAVYDNSAGTIGSFNGISVSPSDVLVKYTYLGDTDIDGDVDASDLARVLQGLNGLGSGWNFGDVNHDGVVDFFDLGRVQAALLGQGDPLGTASIPGGGGVIPEPSSLGLLALALPLLSRRRR